MESFSLVHEKRKGRIRSMASAASGGEWWPVRWRRRQTVSPAVDPVVLEGVGDIVDSPGDVRAGETTSP